MLTMGIQTVRILTDGHYKFSLILCHCLVPCAIRLLQKLLPVFSCNYLSSFILHFLLLWQADSINIENTKCEL